MQEEKLKRALQVITKVSKDLELKEIIVGQAKNSIEEIDKRIREA